MSVGDHQRMCFDRLSMSGKFETQTKSAQPEPVEGRARRQPKGLEL